MKRIQFHIAIIFILLGGISQAQNTFEISYSTGRNDQARAVVQAFDSGYVVVGNTENYDGNTDAYLMKTDNKGAFLWGKRIGGLGNDGGEDLIQLPDSGFAIVGYTYINSSYDVFFIRTDKDGDTLFTKHFGGADWDLGYSLQPTSDNGFILAGESHENGNSKGYLIKLNASGETIWTKKYGGNALDKFEDIIISYNDDYIIAGETSSFGNGRQAYIVRTDTSGGIIWERNFGNPGVNFAKSVTELSTGDIIFAGGTNTIPSPDIDNWGVKINVTGNFIEEHIVFDYTPSTPIVENDDWNQFVITQKDSVIFGGKRSYDNSEDGNIYLYRYTQTIDFPGKISDFQKFMAVGEDIAYDAKVTYDQGVVYVCTGEFMDSSPASIYLMKMDSTLAWSHPFFNSVSFQNDYSSINENDNSLEVSIYPNPSNSFVNIAIDNNKQAKINIHDLNGKLVKNFNSKNSIIQFDVSDMNEGMYIVTVISGNKNVTKKLVVTK